MENAFFTLKSTVSVITRQTILVSLFASATVPSRNPCRASRALTHRARLSLRFFAQRITARAPWIIKVRIHRFPYFVIEDNRVLLPELCYRRASPHHADNSLPLENCAVSTSLTKTAAINGPTLLEKGFG